MGRIYRKMVCIPFQDEAIMSTLYNTLIIALLSALIATVIGTLASIGIQSMNRKFRTFMLGVTNIPMLNADIVTGVSMMLLFIAFRYDHGIYDNPDRTYYL